MHVGRNNNNVGSGNRCTASIANVLCGIFCPVYHNIEQFNFVGQLTLQLLSSHYVGEPLHSVIQCVVC